MSYKCPKCGGTQFYAAATERVLWIIDEDGHWFETVKLLDVVERPSADEVWECYYCGYEALGSDFIVEEQDSEN